MRAFAKAGNRMSTARRYFLARLILTIRYRAKESLVRAFHAPESIPIFTGVVRILTGVSKGVQLH